MSNQVYLHTGKKEHVFIEVPLVIKPYDIDAAGHVNNIVYVRWLEDMRNRLISSVCDLDMLLQSGLYLAVISTEINYRKQLKLFDRPKGYMEISRFEHGIFLLNSEITLHRDIIAAAEQKCVIMDLHNSKMITGKYYK